MGLDLARRDRSAHRLPYCLAAWVAGRAKRPAATGRPADDAAAAAYGPPTWSTLFVGFGLFASFGFLPQLPQTPTAAGYGFGASVTESGRLMLPSAVASFLVGFFTARLMELFGPARSSSPARLLSAVVRGHGAAPRQPRQMLVGITVRASAPAWSSPASPRS